MSNDFGGGFDATDEATKVAAPPLADITPPLDATDIPVPTNHQPTDGIGIRTATIGQLFHPLGSWDPITGTTNPESVIVGASNQIVQAGTQPIDSQAR